MVSLVETIFFGLLIFFVLGSAVGAENRAQYELNYASTKETSHKTYQVGVNLGIINSQKYPFTSFQRDEQNVFKDLYNEYVSSNGSMPINYNEWLVMNNFGILADTQESLFEWNITKRSVDDKRQFLNTVKKGDILITSLGTGGGGLIGHAAIMSDDYWVLEMPGGKGWELGIPDNNRQVPKYKWYDMHAADGTTVYRCSDSSVANEAATWADHNYYDPKGSATKTIHVEYRLTTDILSKNPSYCSKLVIHAYYYGTGSKKVIKKLSRGLIVPSTIPSYFLSPYRLVNKGKF